MTGDGDSRDEDERTRIGGAPPKMPQPKREVPADPSGPSDGDSTHIAPSVAPARIVAPSAGEPSSAAEEGEIERTRVAVGPPAAVAGGAVAPAARTTPEAPPMRPPAPPLPGTAERTSPAAEPVPPAVADLTITSGLASNAIDDERTVVLAPQADSSMRLERVQQGDTCEVIALNRATFLMGRGHGSDIELRTPTASRQHARLSFQGGQWMLTAMERKIVYVDGVRLSEGGVRLRGGMQLRLGDDEFRVVDEEDRTAVPIARAGFWHRLAAAVRRLFGRRG